MKPDNPIAGIDPGELGRDYFRRGLDGLCDADLLDAVVDVLHEPRDRMTSFTLHAPLEALARYSLLPYVRPEYRELARTQLVAVAGLFQTIPAAPAIGSIPDPSSSEQAWHGLYDAINGGHVAQAEFLADWLADHTRWDEAIRKIGDAVLDSLAAAAHAPIFLYLMQRLGPGVADSALPFLRPYCRVLADGHDLRLATAAEAGRGEVSTLAAKVVAERISRTLGSTNHGDVVGGGIAPMVLATEGAHAEDVGAWFPSGPFEDCDAVFAAITRVAAASMLQDERRSAKYGWTHCLTIPHGLWSIIDHVTDRTGALWLASTVAYAFRATEGRSVVAPEAEPERTSLVLRDALFAGPEAAAGAAFHAGVSEVEAVRTELATQAAIRNDAHLVKYTLACLDVATMDPAYARLYHAAAAYLVSVWMATTPAESLLENLATDRT